MDCQSCGEPSRVVRTVTLAESVHRSRACAACAWEWETIERISTQGRALGRIRPHIRALGRISSNQTKRTDDTESSKNNDLDQVEGPSCGKGGGGVRCLDQESGLISSPISPAPSQPSDPDRLERTSKKPARETEAFRAFWGEQLRKVAKANALRAWHKQGCEALALTVLAGWRAQLPAMRARDLEHVPHPSSWLNARRWDDAVEVPKAQGGKSGAPGAAGAVASPYCDWHRDGTRSRVPSKFPKGDCPDCRRCTAKAAGRVSEPMPLELPGWALTGGDGG